MDLRRLRASDWAAGFFGAALIGLLWAPWYKSLVVPAAAHAVSRKDGWTVYGPLSAFVRSSDGWQAMAVNDVILLIAGLLGIWVVIATASYSTAAVPIAAAVFATFAGVLASVLAVVRLIWPPDLGPGPTSRGSGVWLAMDAAIGLTVCAALAMRDERRGTVPIVPITKLPAPRVSEEGSGA